MKKILMTLTAVFCCAMAMAVFTSCSKSDDNGGGGVTPAAPDTTPVSMKFAYVIFVSPDLIKYADVEINYLDDSGNVKSEKITSTDAWTKVYTLKFPHKMAAKLQLTKRSDVDYSKLTDDTEVYFATLIDHAYTLYNKAGESLKDFSNTLKLQGIGLKGTKIEKYIDGLGKDKDAITFEYDANGKESETKGAW